jgi:hypothetical protein
VRLPETTWSGILLKLWGSQAWLPPAFSRRLEFGHFNFSRDALWGSQSWLPPAFQPAPGVWTF